MDRTADRYEVVVYAIDETGVMRRRIGEFGASGAASATRRLRQIGLTVEALPLPDQGDDVR